MNIRKEIRKVLRESEVGAYARDEQKRSCFSSAEINAIKRASLTFDEDLEVNGCEARIKVWHENLDWAPGSDKDGTFIVTLEKSFDSYTITDVESDLNTDDEWIQHAFGLGETLSIKEELEGWLGNWFQEELAW